MAFTTAVNDRRISDLIDQVQIYSNPTGQIPAPPSITYPATRLGADRLDAVEAGQLERAPRPPWFEPIQHPDDREHLPDEDSIEVPIIGEEGEVPDPSHDDASRIEACGIDALAYYAPFHFFRRSRWGIYIRDYGIAYLASRFLGRKNLTRSDNWALRCAYWLLFEHEYFHFQTEVAATHYEVLTDDLKAYEQIFYDGHTSWLEESLANARAYRHLKDHEDAQLTFPRIEHFKGFASSWMKTQPPGYRDFDRWCKTPQRMQKGRSALTSRLHEISCYSRHHRSNVSSDVLSLYEKAEYSRIPVVRVHDSGIPWLRSARLFPKAGGLQIFVYTREHPPAHIHVDFLDGDKSVRVDWPSLNPLSGEPSLSARELKDVKDYLKIHQNGILEKLRTVFQQPNLPPAI